VLATVNQGTSPQRRATYSPFRSGIRRTVTGWSGGDIEGRRSVVLRIPERALACSKVSCWAPKRLGVTTGFGYPVSLLIVYWVNRLVAALPLSNWHPHMFLMPYTSGNSSRDR
jgi:hypothetical protein